MNQRVLEHLCEAFLFGSLYTEDFISLLNVDEKKEQEFSDKVWEWYEDWNKKNEWKEDYVEWWKEFAKYMIWLVKEWEEA